MVTFSQSDTSLEVFELLISIGVQLPKQQDFVKCCKISHLTSRYPFRSTLSLLPICVICVPDSVNPQYDAVLTLANAKFWGE